MSLQHFARLLQHLLQVKGTVDAPDSGVKNVYGILGPHQKAHLDCCVLPSVGKAPVVLQPDLIFRKVDFIAEDELGKVLTQCFQQLLRQLEESTGIHGRAPATGPAFARLRAPGAGNPAGQVGLRLRPGLWGGLTQDAGDPQVAAVINPAAGLGNGFFSNGVDFSAGDIEGGLPENCLIQLFYHDPFLLY